MMQRPVLRLHPGVLVFIISFCVSAAAEYTCVPGRYYCGTQISRFVHQKSNVQERSLYQCELDGGSFVNYAICDLRCKAVDDENAYCLCTPNKRYCGHELNELRTGSYANESLYACDDFGLNASLIEACSGECLKASPSRCSRTCSPGSFYCGRQLEGLGFDEYDNDTIFLCDPTGMNAARRVNCARGMCASDYCKCEPGQYYCGHELYQELGWNNYKTITTAELLQCARNGSMVTMVNRNYFCPKCVQRETNHSMCECEPGSKCGPECRPRTNTSWCACKGKAHYCGHELTTFLGWQDYHNKTIYECFGGNNVKIVQSCHAQCMTAFERTLCGGQCLPGSKHCGSKLNQMGYNGYKNDSVYVCKNEHSSLVLAAGETNNLCAKGCTPGRTYCGHEVQYIQPVDADDLQVRYKCKEDRTLETTAQCTTCINNGDGAYCQCIPGWRYCASVIYETGWKGYNEVIPIPKNITNDTIFRCKEEEEVEYVEKCGKDECTNTESGTAFCLCKPNRTYCGHELYERYNSPDTYLYPNYIYKCSASRRSVKVEETCVNCVRMNGSPPRCRQECTVGQYYCGSDLLLLEGWQNQDVRPNWLYQCDNTTTEQPIAECSADCVSSTSNDKGGRQRAHCTIPWYWIFGGITLTLIFLTLGSVFVRYFLKHRRLKKSIEAHRIDSNQLETIKLLGKGEFGEVWQAHFKSDEGTPPLCVALKISNEKTATSAKLACANCFIQEIVALDLLCHRNIIKAFGICTNYKDRFGSTVPALVLEYMNGGSAISYLRSERERVSGRDLLHILIDICHAGDHLFTMGIIHRDIAARNVLVQTDFGTGRVKVAKLTDFGLAKDIGKKMTMYKSAHPERISLPFRYTAPEAISGCFSSKSDVWSFGVLMWELYMVLEEPSTSDRNAMLQGPGPTPYSDIREASEVLEMVRDGLKLDQPKMAPNAMYRKMLDCWNKKPEWRPSFKDLIAFFGSKQGTSEQHLIAPLPSVLETVNDSQPIRFDEMEMQPCNHDGYVSPCSNGTFEVLVPEHG